jgi:hypothetical protein
MIKTIIQISIEMMSRTKKIGVRLMNPPLVGLLISIASGTKQNNRMTISMPRITEKITFNHEN